MERFDDDAGLQGFDPVAPAAFRNQDRTVRIATGDGGTKGYLPTEESEPAHKADEHVPTNGTAQYHRP